VEHLQDARGETVTWLNDCYKRDGVVVVRSALDIKKAYRWARAWAEFIDDHSRDPAQYHPTEWLIDDSMPEILRNIYKCDQILYLVELLLGPDICMYNKRFVVKDSTFTRAVPLHQDCGYHRGHFKKLSAFVPLTTMTPENGGLSFVLRSQEFGYLGDAGYIDEGLIDEMGLSVYSPTVFPGDVVLMHSSVWHKSGERTDGPDRVLADIHYQPADDPSGVELVRGQWRTPFRYNEHMRSAPFTSSRMMRLAAFEQGAR
jgi:ectoine hydroxylase-related dioxygenase (phytanoyl-CoA dioxygenase family)